MMVKKRVDIITMGCSKNLVDSERLIKMFENKGFAACHNPDKVTAPVVVVNTCGFIGDAKQESIDMILEVCRAKHHGPVKKVYVMGCLSERYATDLPGEIPEVDGWYGKFDWHKIIGELGGSAWERTLTTPPYMAYVKIAEGCNRFCAFCAIPLITGRYKSRPIEEIVEEVRALVSNGVKEFNIIAQDLSYYGKDIYGRQRIADLVEAMARVPGVEWIRLHYAYPTDFPYDLLPVMARYDNVCKYLDIALQHTSDNVLANMKRHITGSEQRELLRRIREEVPGIHLRTTLMVGFPGEGQQEFEELMQFVRDVKFERMGAFAYCEEDDTYAANHYADDIPQAEKDRRLDRLMDLQQEISLAVNRAKIGSEMRVLVESEQDTYYVGRTQYDSPEVDPEVLIRKSDGKPMEIGQFYTVCIVDAEPYELIAEQS